MKIVNTRYSLSIHIEKCEMENNWRWRWEKSHSEESYLVFPLW